MNIKKMLIISVVVLILLGVCGGLFLINNKEEKPQLKEEIKQEAPEQPQEETPVVEEQPEVVETTSNESVDFQPRMSEEDQHTKVGVRSNPTERETGSEIPKNEKGDDSIDAVINETVEAEEEFQVETPAEETLEEVQEETTSQEENKSNDEITESNDFSIDLFKDLDTNN